MSVKMDSFSFKPANTDEQSTPIVEAVPTPEADFNAHAESASKTAVMVGCGVAGWIIAGPFMALLTALGGAYAAEHNEGPIGDASRSVGHITAHAGQKAREERLVGKVKEAISSIFKRKEKGHRCEACNSQTPNPVL